VDKCIVFLFLCRGICKAGNVILQFIYIKLQLLMTQTELIKQLAATKGKTKVDKLSMLIKESQFSLHDLVPITFHPDKVIAFRAAWMLENVILNYTGYYINDIEYLISNFREITNPSCQRHYAKIAMHVSSPKMPIEIKERLANIDLEPIVEQCFDWLIDPDVLIAVKVHAAEALFNMRSRYPWITEELAEQLQYLMKDGSAAIQARGKKLLSKL